MTDKELRRLSRAELIDIIYELQKQAEAQAGQYAQLEAALNDRTLRLSSAGSIAEAAIGVNQVFEAAQAAADQYLLSLQTANAGLDEKIAAAEQRGREILEEAQRQADHIVGEAERRAKVIVENANRQAAADWSEFKQKADELLRAHAELRTLVGKVR